MMNNSMNNGAANNNNSNNGGFIIATGTMTVKTFADMVKEALSVHLEGCTIELRDVTKNNGCTYHGLSIREHGSNIAQNIYLDKFFGDYRDGRSFADIVRVVVEVYKANRVPSCFDTGRITDYERAKDRICFKLVNTDRNSVFLSDVPCIPFCDLSVIFYVFLDNGASATVHNGLLDTWGIDIDTLLEKAKYNTPRLLPVSVQSMESALFGLFNDEPGDFDFLDTGLDDIRPAREGFNMYIATNKLKMNGAAVFLYDFLLSGFADRIGADFYIIPSSVHELIFLPELPSMDKEGLREMVLSVNSEVVKPEDILSDSIYHYSRATGLVEIA